MLVAKKNRDLILSEKEGTILYEFGIAQQIISPEEIIKNRITAEIEKTFIKKDHIGYLYQVKINKRSQSNTEDMLGIEDELAFLEKEIVLYTNDKGKIISIVNRGQIKEDWYFRAKRIQKEYKQIIPEVSKFVYAIEALINDNVAFVSLIQKSEVYSALFPPVYNQNLAKKKTIQQYKNFDNFFDTTTLPFKIDTVLTGINTLTQGKQMIRSGKLDTSIFNKTSASELFTKVYGAHEYSLNFKASYLETFDLDQEGEVDKSTIMLGVTVSDIYQLKQISKLKKKG